MPYHLIGWFPESVRPAAHFGWIGVDLFFVLSGYLIAGQLLRQVHSGGRLRVGEFYRRRAWRILPSYLTVLLLYVLWPGWREAPGMQPAWQFATFIENLVIDYSRNQAFSHAWSLCVEEHFYLCLPLLMWLLLRRPCTWKVWTVLGLAFLLGIGIRLYVFEHVLRPLGPDDNGFSTSLIEYLYYPTWVRLDGLLAGVSLALLQRYRPTIWARLTRHGAPCTGCGLAVLAGACWLTATRFNAVNGRAMAGAVFGYPLLALGFAGLVLGAVSVSGPLARWRIPGARVLAGLAFTLYLTHKEAAHLLAQHVPRLHEASWAHLAVLAVVCLSVAAVLHVLVERPALRARDLPKWRGGCEEVINDPAI